MASLTYTTGLKDIQDGTVKYLTETIKVMLVTSAYTASKDDLVVDTGGAGDPESAELNVTGYTRGYGGAGRKTLTSKTIVANLSGGSPANTIIFDAADLTWTSLGAGQTIEGSIAIKEGGANDTTSRLLAFGDFSQVTNGGDVTLQWPSDGVMRQNN